MKQLSERQQRTFEEIKEKKRRGVIFSDWEKKFLLNEGLQSEIDKMVVVSETEAEAYIKFCVVCLGEEKFSFKRLEDDFKKINGIEMNIKGTIWSFACPNCKERNKHLRPIEQVLLTNPKWEFRHGEDVKKRLEEFFFYN